MITYKQATDLMSRARNERAGKPLGNNCRLFRVGASFDVVLHRTTVVTINPGNTFTIKTGGWHTDLTRRWIEYASPARINTHGLHGPNPQLAVVWGPHGSRHQCTIPRDGLLIDADGTPVDPPDDPIEYTTNNGATTISDRRTGAGATVNWRGCLVVGTDRALSFWGGAEGGYSYAAWACTHEQVDQVESWAKNRGDLLRVRVVDAADYRPGPSCRHLSIYPTNPGHPALS